MPPSMTPLRRFRRPLARNIGAAFTARPTISSLRSPRAVPLRHESGQRGSPQPSRLPARHRDGHRHVAAALGQALRITGAARCAKCSRSASATTAAVRPRRPAPQNRRHRGSPLGRPDRQGAGQVRLPQMIEAVRRLDHDLTNHTVGNSSRGT